MSVWKRFNFADNIYCKEFRNFTQFRIGQFPLEFDATFWEMHDAEVKKRKL